MPLYGISPLIPPDLLRVLAAMGHGDEVGACAAAHCSY
jgi:L-fucose mutarotase/ribose pyranase (RbsD/FucU family)